MNLFFDPSFSLRRSRCLGCKKKRTVKFSLISLRGLSLSLSHTRRRLTRLLRIASRWSRTAAVVKEVFTPESRPLSQGFSTHPNGSPPSVRYMTKSIVSPHLSLSLPYYTFEFLIASPLPPSQHFHFHLHPFFPLPHLPQKLGLDAPFPFCRWCCFEYLYLYLSLLSLQKAAYLFIY